MFEIFSNYMAIAGRLLSNGDAVRIPFVVMSISLHARDSLTHASQIL